MVSRPNILFITSDQQRGDCYGFEGRQLKTPHLDQLARDGTRFSACITPNLGVPALARLDPDRPAAAHARRAGQRHRPRPRDRRARLRRHARRGRLRTRRSSARRISRPSHTFAADRHARMPHRARELRPGLARAVHGLRARRADASRATTTVRRSSRRAASTTSAGTTRDGAARRRTGCYRTQLPPMTGAAQTWHSALPVAWHNSTWIGDRTIDYLREHQRPSRSAPGRRSPIRTIPFDCPEPWSRLHDPDEVDLPRAPHARSRAAAVVAPRQPRRHAAARGRRRCASSARSIAHAGADRRAAART